MWKCLNKILRCSPAKRMAHRFQQVVHSCKLIFVSDTYKQNIEFSSHPLLFKSVGLRGFRVHGMCMCVWRSGDQSIFANRYLSKLCPCAEVGVNIYLFSLWFTHYLCRASMCPVFAGKWTINSRLQSAKRLFEGKVQCAHIAHVCTHIPKHADVYVE